MKKKIIISISILLFAISTVKVFAYFQTKKTVYNEFKVAKVNVGIEENFDNTTWPNTTKKEVMIINYDEMPVIVRVMYTEIWKYDNNQVSNKLDGTNVVNKEWTEEFENNWIYHDGWYYYKKLLNGNSQVQIMKSIKLNNELVGTNEKYIEGQYELTFHYEAIQPTKKAVKKLWNHDINIENENVNWEF